MIYGEVIVIERTREDGDRMRKSNIDVLLGPGGV